MTLSLAGGAIVKIGYRRRLFRASLRLRGESRSEGITVSLWVARTRKAPAPKLRPQRRLLPHLAGGFNKTLSLSGSEPPNRVVLLQFANMDAVKAWRKEGEADLENDVGEIYAKFRVYAAEGATQ